MLIYVVVCINEDGSETHHLFSTSELAQAYADTDDRPHVLLDYLVDCPERHEGQAS